MYVCFELINENLCLKNANVTFLERTNLNTSYFTKEVSHIFDDVITKSLLEKYYFFLNKKEELSTLLISDKPSSLSRPMIWKFYIRFEHSIVHCIGVQDDSSNESLFNYHLSRIHNFHFFSSFFITICKNKDSFYIKTDDNFLLECYQKSTMIGEPLDVIDLFNYQDNVINLLDECMQHKNVIDYVDSTINSKGILFYKVHLIPSNTNSDELQLLYTLIPEIEYENEQYKKYSSLTYLPHGSLHAIGTILWNKETNYYNLNFLNEYAHYMCDELSIDLHKIIKSKEYHLTLEHNIFTHATYILRNKQGLSIPITVNFVPLNTVSKISKVMIVATKPEQYLINKQIERFLTHRELEVASLIAQNKTNKYIAYKLKISEGTVKRINYNIYQKLGISSRVELTKILYHCAEETT